MTVLLRGKKTPTQRAIAVLRRFGPDAHVYLPGVGMLNGLQAANYIDSAGIAPGAVDQPVGLVLDATGGIHATQPTPASKPILRRGAVNLLTYSGDLSNGAWGKLDIAVSVGLFAGPDGSLSSRKIIELATANYHQFSQVISPVAGTYTQAVICKPSGASHITLNPVNQGNAFSDSNNRAVTFDLATGAMTQVNGAGVTHSTLALGNGFYLFTATATTAVNSFAGPTVRLSNTATPGQGVSYTGNGTSGIFVQSIALFQGTYTAAQIQALGGIPLTTTAPASTALGPQYWSFDGTNDSLSLGGPLFQMADDHCVVAGGLSTLATGDRYFLDHGSSASVSPMVASLSLAGTLAKVYWRDDANVMTLINGGFVAQGSVAILSARKVSTTGVLRVNGQQVASAAIAAGATTLTGAAIGTRVSPANMLAGQVYPVIAIKGTVPDADLLLLEKWVGSISGVTIL